MTSFPNAQRQPFRVRKYLPLWISVALFFAGAPTSVLSADPLPDEKQFQATVDKINREIFSGLDTASFLVELENRMARKPGQAPWLQAAGALHFRVGQYDKARRALLQLKKPTSRDDRLLALSLYEMKEYRKALAYFNRLQSLRTNRNDWEKFCHALSKGGTKVDALKEWESYRSRYSGVDLEGKNAGLDFLAECYRRPLQKEKLLPILEALLKKNQGLAEEGKLLLETSKLYGETHLKALELREQYLKLQPQDHTASRELAGMYEARQEIKKAIPLYLEIAPNFTADLKFNRHLADILAKTDRERALLFYETCRTLAPHEFEIPLAMGRLEEELKRPELALESYKLVLEINPTHVLAKERMLILIASSKSAGPWLKTMVENEKKNPKDHEFQFKLSKLFLAAQDRDQAYKYLQKALQNSQDKEEYADLLPQVVTTEAQVLKNFPLLQKLALKPNASAELLVLVGRGYSLYHNQSKAAETFARVLSLKPKLLEKQRQPILDFYAYKNYAAAGLLAEKYLLNDAQDVDIRRIYVTALSETNANPTKLRTAIQELIALEPFDDKWYFRLAELDLAAKDTAAALKHGYEWVKMHPDDRRGLLFLEPLAAKAKEGEIYSLTLDRLARLEPASQSQYELKAAYFLFESGKFSQATEALGKLTTAFPNEARLWNRLGLSQIKIGREGAAEALEKAYRLEPTQLEYARHFGKALNTDTELKPNVEVFRFLNRGNPDKHERRKLAHALFLNGNFSASALEWDWFLKNEPDMAVDDSTAGMAYLKSGQISKAKPLLEKRLAVHPRNLGLLAILSELYEKEGDSKKRMFVMEKLVQEDQRMGDFVLRLAKEKEKAGLNTEALALYSQWSFRHQDDLLSLKSYRDLAEKHKDTTALIESLRLLTQNKDSDRNHQFQLAEVYFARSGETKELEELVKTNPDYTRGKRILISEYHSKQAWGQLGALEGFLTSEAANHSDVLETLGDLYAHQKRQVEANQIYYSWLAVRRKDRAVFDKVYAYAKENQGANLIPILKMGCESFPEDLALRANFGASMGNSRSALEAYQQVIAKKPNQIESVVQAAEIAKAIGDRAAQVRWSKRWSELKPDEEKPWRYLIESLNPTSEKEKLAHALEGLQRITPGNFDLVIQLARLHEELKHFESAISFYRKGLYLNPKDKSVRNRLIVLMKSMAKKEELADVLMEIQNIDSSAHEAQFELAKLYLQKQDKEKAYAYLISALDQSPLDQNYQRLLPKVIHNREQILRHFKLLVEMYSRPETSRSDRNNLDLYMLLGKGYAVQGLWEESANCLSLAHQLDAKILSGDREAILACYRGKKFALTSELAEKYFEKTMDFDKEIRQIQILCYEKTMKDPGLIRKTLQLLLAVDKENAGGQLRLAELDLKAKDTTAAIQNIRNCLTTSPNELRAYKLLLPLISKNGADQRVTYMVVLEKLSILDSAHKADHLVELSDFYYQRKNYRQTARLLSQVVEINSTDAASWFRLGQCRSQLQVGDLGLDCFRRAWEIQPSHLPFAHTYAQALGTPEQFKVNLKLFQFTEDRDPSIHEKMGLAMAYFYNADFNNSAKAWDQVLGEKAMEGKYFSEAALAYVKTSQPGKALPLYELRREREAQNLGLLDTLYHLYTKTNNEKGRLSLLEDVVLLNPAYKDFQLQLAKAKEKIRDTVSAIDHYGQWTARNTTDVEALKAMHRLAQSHADTTSLEGALRLLVPLKGVEIEYAYQLAELQFKFTGDPAGIEKLVKAHGDYHRGKIILVKEYFRRFDLVKMIPFEKALATEAVKDPELTAPLAELYAYQKKHSQANQAFRDNLVLRAQKAKSPGSPLALEMRPAFEKAWLYGETHKSEFQIEVLEIGNLFFPREPPIQHALAKALGRDRRALDLYRLILDKDGNDILALRNASELAMVLGKYPEAISLLEQWSKIEPGTIRNWQLLTEAYVQIKDPAKTADALDHLTLISPNDAALAFRTGKAYLEAKNREKALEFLIRADELKPKDPAYAFEVLDLLKVMTEAFLSKGQVSKAIELFGLLLDREPKNKKANLYIGIWLAENQDYATAVNMLKTGIEHSSEDKPILAKAWRLLGNGLASRGERSASLEAYKRALTLDPSDKVAAASRLDLTRALSLNSEVHAALADVVRLDSSQVEAGMELAEIHLKEGQFIPAAALFRRATMTLDSAPDVWGRYGEALEGSKRNAEALAAWEKSFSLGDRIPYNLHGLARLHREAGTLNKAARALEELVDLQPENDEASFWLAELALENNNLEMAEEMFAQAAQANANNIEYTQGLAEVYLRRGDAESVLEILDPVRGRLSSSGRLAYADGLRMAGKPELAIPLYQEVYPKAPSPRALTGYADAQLDLNKPDEAKKWIEGSNFQGHADVRLRLGKAYLALHEKEKAAKIFQALVKEDKSNAVYLLALAQVHFQQKNYPLALNGFSEALQKRSDLALAAFGAGQVLVANGQINEGRNYFYALAQNLSKAERVLGLRGLAAAALAEKKESEALEHLLQAVDIFPTSEALAELSRISLKLGRVKEAEEIAQKSLEADEDFSPGIVALSEVMMAQGQKEDARDFLKESLTRNPRACEIHIEYAKVMVAMENFSGLASTSSQAMNLCPDEPMSHYFAGVSADRNYQKKQAEVYFKSYKKLGGDPAVLPKGY